MEQNTQMTNSKHLANRLRDVILSGTWIANTNVKDQLEHLDWTIATQKIDTLHTISELAQHLHYYLNGIKEAIAHGKLEIRDAYSFDFPPMASQEQWEAFQNRFWKDTEQLAQLVEKMTDAELALPFVDKKYGNYTQNIDGLIEHSYYHLGQIVLIKKLTASKG